MKNDHSDGKTNNLECTFQVDYTASVGKLHTIEAGAKYILRRNSSDNHFFEATQSINNDDVKEGGGEVTQGGGQ